MPSRSGPGILSSTIALFAAITSWIFALSAKRISPRRLQKNATSPGACATMLFTFIASVDGSRFVRFISKILSDYSVISDRKIEIVRKIDWKICVLISFLDSPSLPALQPRVGIPKVRPLKKKNEDFAYHTPALM